MSAAAFIALCQRELSAAQAKADADENRLAAAARGEPFWNGWGTRRMDPSEVVGLDAFIPTPRRR